MLRKLVTLAVTGGLAKKAFDMYRERHARADAEEKAMLAKMAEQIEPAAAKPARKAPRRGRRGDAPHAG
jgi:hypothetical protein